MSQTTLFVIAYDIPNDKRRTKVHKALAGFGEWTQYSLFECFLTDRDVVKLRSRLGEILDPSEDSVRIYSLCSPCRDKIETIGSPPPEERTIYIV